MVGYQYLVQKILTWKDKVTPLWAVTGLIIWSLYTGLIFTGLDILVTLIVLWYFGGAIVALYSLYMFVRYRNKQLVVPS